VGTYRLYYTLTAPTLYYSMRVLVRSEAARWSAVLESIANTTLVPKVEIDLRDRL